MKDAATCDFYEEPGQDCFTAGRQVQEAEGMCGPCVTRLLTRVEIAESALEPGTAPMPDTENGALAEAYERGRADERMHAAAVRDYAHWSSISAGPPVDPPNPYRVIPPERTDASGDC